jgi:hypothetical protein
VIGSGQPVYLNDHVTTGPDGRLQILLLDQTTFTVGPNSDMVLDEFVYDPKTSVGSVSAQILKGVFRFVTGKIAQHRPSSMKVVLPVGTIGIRGTMVAGSVDGKNADIVLIGPGPENDAQERRGGITVTNAFGHTDINASGYGTTIRDGGRPSRGFRFSRVELDRILGGLSSRQTNTGTNGGPVNAGRASGEWTAQGGVNYQSWSNLNTINTSNNQTTTFASQQAASSCGNGIDCWSDLLAIETGSAGYQGSGNISCSGSGCSGNVGSTFSFGLNVYFNTQTIAGDGGTSYINISAPIEGTFDSTTNIGPISYAGRSGPATYTLNSGDASWNSGTGSSAGSTITFLKGSSGAASTLQLNLNYTNSEANVTSVTGTGTAPKGSPILPP